MIHKKILLFIQHMSLMIFPAFATLNNTATRILDYVVLRCDDFISVGEILKGRTLESKNMINFYCNLPNHFPKREHFTKEIYENYFPTLFLILDVINLLHFCQYNT